MSTQLHEGSENNNREGDVNTCEEYVQTRRGLVIPVDVLPGEGLAELVFRAASVNGYFNIRGITRQLDDRVQQVSPFSISNKLFDYGAMATLLGLTGGRQELERLTYPKVDVAGSAVVYFGAMIREKSITSQRRVSPRALKDADYQRAVWSLRGLCFDPHNRERLMELCPVCGKKLTFFYTFGASKCGRCAFLAGSEMHAPDLRDFPQEIIEIDDEEALDFVTGLIGPDQNSQRSARGKLHPDLHIFDRGLIYEIVIAMALMLSGGYARRKGPRPGERELITPKPENLAKAARALLDWPSGFHEIMSDLRRTEIAQSKQRDVTFICPLQMALKDPLYGEKFSSRLLAEADVGLQGSLLAAVKRSRDANFTDVSPKGDQKAGGGGADWKRWAALSLELDNSTDGTAPGTNLNVVVRAVRVSTAIREQSVALGIPTSHLVDCYLEGLVVCPDPQLVDLFAYEASLQDALEETFKAVSRGDRQPIGAQSLRNCLAVLDFSEANCWPRIISSVRKGELEVWVGSSEHRSLMKNTFVTDFAKLRAIIDAQVPDKRLFNISPLWVEYDMLGLIGPAVSTIISSGHLRRSCSFADFWAFRKRWSTAEEVAHRLRMEGVVCNRNRIGAKLRAAEVPTLVLSGGKFTYRGRDEVEQLFWT